MQAVLLIYVEPTPYVLGSIRAISASYKGRVDVLFLGSNLTQSWDLTLDGMSASYLPASTPAAARELVKRISGRPYRVLHLGGGWGHPVLLWAMVLGWWYRVPLYVESDTPLPVGLPLWKRAAKRLLYPFLFRIPRKVLPAGTRQAEYFRHYGVGDDRIVIVQMTVDVTDMIKQSDAIRADGGRSVLRRAFGLEDSQTVFLYVGRLEPTKGVITLLEAFGVLSQTRTDVALLIVGDGSELTRVEAAARKNPRVKYAGRLRLDGVIRAYGCADVVVLPSLREQWGLVINEAMAMGLPVIVSDRAGCVDDLLKNGETGAVVRAGSVEELRSSMLVLAENPERRTQMGRAGRRLIADWTLERQAALILGAWNLGTNS